MHPQHVRLADAIHEFKFHPKDMSPPAHVMSQDQLTARAYAITDLTNKLAEVLEQTSKTKFNKDEWLNRALGTRKK
jgi:hypothetical protein